MQELVAELYSVLHKERDSACWGHQIRSTMGLCHTRIRQSCCASDGRPLIKRVLSLQQMSLSAQLALSGPAGMMLACVCMCVHV